MVPVDARPLDARPFVAWIRDTYEPACRVGAEAGHYGRSPGRAHPLLYGVADLACIRWTIDELEPTVAERAEWAAAFETFRQPDGTYVEHRPTHHPWPSTAFAIAAMELLDLPAAASGFVARHDPAEVLDRLDWRDDVYLGSHVGAAIGALAVLCDADLPADWWARYWAALEARLDPATGVFGDGKPPGGDSDQIGGTFHYAFLYEHLGRRLPHAAARTDTVLGLRTHDGLWHPENHRWLTLDAVYLLARAAPDDPRVRATLREVLAIVTAESLSERGRAWFSEWYLGAHDLTATVSLLAEAQRLLGPDEVVTERQLRPVLDRRPFI